MAANDDIDDKDYVAALRAPGVQLPLSHECRVRLEKLCAKPSRRNKLWEQFISPYLLMTNLNQHIPIHESKKNDFADRRSGKAYYRVQAGTFVQDEYSLFSNPLRRPAYGPGFPIKSDRWHQKWERPIERPVVGPFWVFTFEWDSDLPDALQVQFDWAWKKGSDGQTAIERLDLYLREKFKDYRGYSVVWSGSKSIHIHLIFDPAHMSRATIIGLAEITGKSSEARIRDHWRGDIRRDAIWEYYRTKWWQLHGLFCDVAGVSIQFDESLQTLFQKRRLPWGVRVAESNDPYGFQEGDLIPQVVLDENLRKTSPKSAAGYLLTSDEANALPVSGPARKGGGGYAAEVDADDILDALTKYLRAQWGREYPKPARLSEIDGRLYLNFFNHAADQRPSSFVREDFSQIIYLGKGAPTDDEAVRSLPGGMCLEDLLMGLVEEDESRGRIVEGETLDRGRPSFRHPAYNLFARRAGDQSLCGIRDGMAVGAWHVSTVCPRSLIVSTEGAGKSTALIRQALAFQLEDSIEEYFQGQGLVHPQNGFHVVASLSYEQAEEQYQRYVDWCRYEGRPASAVLLKSFDQYYAEYFERRDCPEGEEPISWVSGLDMGYNSQVDAVFHEQPEVYEAITKAKNDAWVLSGLSTEPSRSEFHRRMDTLIFTSHKLAQSFNQPSKSKAWLHPDFDPVMGRDEWSDLAKDFRVYRIIHDELSLDDLLHVATQEEFDMAAAFKAVVERMSGDGWRDVPMSAKFRCFNDHASSDLKEIGFYDTITIIDAGFKPEHRVVVDFDELPFGRDNHDEGLYKGKTGSVMYLNEKSWWFDTRARIAVTTTESLVAEVASQLRDNKGRKVFWVERWDSEQFVPTDSLELNIDARACRKRIQELANDVLADPDDPTEVVLTDMARGDNIYSHAAARGRNDLDDKNITTVLTFIGGDEYAKLNAVAQKFGIGNLIELFYRDRLNQAAGRNRGLRSRTPEASKHKLRVAKTLHQVLGGHQFFGKGRYPAYLVPT